MDNIGEVKLWQSVVLTAVSDALSAVSSSGKSQYRNLEAKKAREWLLKDRNNFVKVCDFANINPNKLRERLKRILSESNGSNKNNIYKIKSQAFRSVPSETDTLGKNLVRSCG